MVVEEEEEAVVMVVGGGGTGDGDGPRYASSLLEKLLN